MHFQLRRLVGVLDIAVNLECPGVESHDSAQEILEVLEDLAKLLVFHRSERQLDALVQELDKCHEQRIHGLSERLVRPGVDHRFDQLDNAVLIEIRASERVRYVSLHGLPRRADEQNLRHVQLDLRVVRLYKQHVVLVD